MTATPAGEPTTKAPFGGLSKPTLIGLVVTAVVLLAMAIFFISKMGSSSTPSGTTQLQANAPQVQQAAPPEGFTPPAPDATGTIVDYNGVKLTREAGQVTQLTLAPGTYINLGGLWSRADEQGKLLLPHGKTKEGATFFSAEDQAVPYTGEVQESTADVTSVAFEGSLSGGYTLSPGAFVYYTDASFQTDPAFIVIPKGNPGQHSMYVGSYPLELAIP